MKIQCPNCNALTTILPQHFSELSELECSVCGELTILKRGLNRIAKIEFVLTEPGMIPEKNNPEQTVETFHQKEVKQLYCSSPQQKVLYEEQHEDVQQE